MGLQDNVSAAFAEHGPVSRIFESYSPRAGQIAMAGEVSQSIEMGNQLVVQAGTGIGKSYAYLVPVLLSGKRAVIATATKALQDQLALRDIPVLLAAMAIPTKVATLKGRSNYLCLHRLAGVEAVAGEFDLPTARELQAVRQWAVVTVDGDLAELHGLRERSPLVPRFTSTSANCVGRSCQYWRQCHVNKARETALAADLVITNHHLFFADAVLDDALGSALLPNAEVVVIDEAHRLPEIGIQALAEAVSMREVDRFCEKLIVQSAYLALGAASWRDWLLRLQSAMAPCRVPSKHGSVAVTQGNIDPTDVSPEDALWRIVAQELRGALLPLEQLLGTLAEMSPAMGELQWQAQHWLALLKTFVEPVAAGSVRWVELGPSARLVQGPVNIAGKMQHLMSVGASGEEEKSAWIFTSATLGLDSSLTWFSEACGLVGAKVMKIQSPFDYERQAALYVPPAFPWPHEALHSSEVAHLVAQGATILGGRTLVLTTSLRAMHTIAEALKEHLRPAAEIEVMVQGEASKRELLQRLAHPNAGQLGVVLVATATFWEGVDISGSALQMVVIDKIPFAAPDDPVVQARSRALVENGRNAFTHFHLEHAAVGLMQGAGRLIRGSKDTGVLVICDVRLHQKTYGQKLLAALPPMARLSEHRDYVAQLRKITTFSTMDHDWT